MKVDWKVLLRRAWLPLAGVGALALIAVALALWAPLRGLAHFTGVFGGSSFALAPGAPRELPPVLPATRWKAVPPAPGAKPIPHLEPKRKADLQKLDRKLGLRGELGKSVDVLATGKLPSGTEVFAVAPRDSGPAKIIAVEPRFKLGGRLVLGGQALTDFKGKVLNGQAYLLSDLARVGRLQLSAGPAGIYDPQTGSRFAVLVRAELCLINC